MRMESLIDEVTGDTNVWLIADRSGSITLMVPFDFTQSGSDPVHYQSYSAFGEQQLTAPTDFDFRFGYTGREWDAEVELNYHRARYYDPGQGRFISQDPLGLDAGDVNLYRYVGNSPLNYADPSGLLSAPFNNHVYNGITQPQHFGWWDSVVAGAAALPGALASTFSSGQAYDSAQGAVTAGVDSFVRNGTFGFYDPQIRNTAALFGNEDAKQNAFSTGEWTVTAMELASGAAAAKAIASKGVQVLARNADELGERALKLPALADDLPPYVLERTTANGQVSPRAKRSSNVFSEVRAWICGWHSRKWLIERRFRACRRISLLRPPG